MSHPHVRSFARRPLSDPRGGASVRPAFTRGPVHRAPIVRERRVIAISDLFLATVGIAGVLAAIAGALVFLMVIAGAGQ